MDRQKALQEESWGEDRVRGARRRLRRWFERGEGERIATRGQRQGRLVCGPAPAFVWPSLALFSRFYFFICFLRYDSQEFYF